VISKGFSGHGVANRDAPFDALLKRLRLEGSGSKPGIGTNSTFCADVILAASTAAWRALSIRTVSSSTTRGSENPRVMIADRLLIIQQVPCHRDLLLRPVRQTADFVRSAEPFNRISLLVAEISMPMSAIPSAERNCIKAIRIHSAAANTASCPTLAESQSLPGGAPLQPQGLAGAAFHCI
jgi:hypothetical protein